MLGYMTKNGLVCICMFVCIWQAVKIKPSGGKSSGFKRVGQQGDSPNTPSPKRRDGRGSEGRQGKGEVGGAVWHRKGFGARIMCKQMSIFAMYSEYCALNIHNGCLS